MCAPRQLIAEDFRESSTTHSRNVAHLLDTVCNLIRHITRASCVPLMEGMAQIAAKMNTSESAQNPNGSNTTTCGLVHGGEE